jgi:hypothetical protein
MCRLKNHYAAGLYTLDKKMQSQGVPPHWLPFINVSNADDIANLWRQSTWEALTTRTRLGVLGPFAVQEKSDPYGHPRKRPGPHPRAGGSFYPSPAADALSRGTYGCA